LGYPLRFILTLGQAADIGQAEALVSAISIKRLMVDKGYDSKAFVEYLENQGIEALIPSRSNALEPRKCD
jgi:beta-lactamase superfamily II metal-dependent hydrolase